MFGNGSNGPATAVSRFVLDNLHHVYGAFGIPLDDTDYFVGPDTPGYYDAFSARNFAVWDRSEDEGADPLQVVLMCFVGVAAFVFMLRGDRRMRLVVLMAVAMTVGYLLLAGVATWQIFEVRFFIPLFVAWSPIIALVLGRCSRWLLRIVLVVLALAALPQLLDNSERPLMRDTYGANPLAPYFLDSTDPSYVRKISSDVEAISRVMAQSNCRQLGIGNFIVFEYPVWVGLHQDGWKGEIQDVDVDNVTARYGDPSFHACAVLTEQPAALDTDPNDIEMKYGSLNLSIAPQDLRTVHHSGSSTAGAAPPRRLGGRT